MDAKVENQLAVLSWQQAVIKAEGGVLMFIRNRVNASLFSGWVTNVLESVFACADEG